jgi:hypothetical protein
LQLSDLQFSNAHAGCCVFVGVGKGKSNESIILDLCKELQSPELHYLQESLIELINASGADETLNEEESAACVKSQMMSTLPLFVNFPPLKNVHHPKFYTHPRFHLLMLGITLI